MAVEHFVQANMEREGMGKEKDPICANGVEDEMKSQAMVNRRDSSRQSLIRHMSQVIV